MRAPRVLAGLVGTVELMPSFDEYQAGATSTAVYPGRGSNPLYPTLGLVGEISEVVGKLTADPALSPDQLRTEVGKELGDVLWYVASLTAEHESSIAKVVSAHLKATGAGDGGVADFTAFQQSVTTWPTGRSADTLAMTMVVHAGVAAERAKKVLRDRGGIYDPASVRAIEQALGHVLVLSAYLADSFDLQLASIAQGNLDKLASRKARGVLAGSGDDR